MIIAGTGHRPPKLGGYGDDVFERLVVLARTYLRHMEPWHVISGMALGWDQALAEAAVSLSIPFTAAVPFEDMHQTWPDHAKARFLFLWEQAQEIVFVNYGDYAPWKMQARNEWMVDHADRLVALWNGVGSGGTHNCLRYAHKAKPNMVVDNLWDAWCN